MDRAQIIEQIFDTGVVTLNSPHTAEEILDFVKRRISQDGWQWGDLTQTEVGFTGQAGVEFYWHPTVTDRSRQAFGPDLPETGFWSICTAYGYDYSV